jgi:membrane protease YdiL (CAAX protease family)
MSALDHAFAIALVLGLPVYAALGFPKMVRKLEAGVAGARASEYVETIAVQWCLTISLVAYWLTIGLPLAWMGLKWPPTTSNVTTTSLFSIVVVAFCLQQARTVARSPEARAQLVAQLDAQPAARALIPRTRAEARLFVAFALTTGSCEEVLYRGYLLWYFNDFLGRGVAVLVVTLVFGVAHAYQGVRGMALAGTLGGISMALYLLTGSLIASIVLHATMNLAHGHMARLALITEGGHP